jgi:hypothetical protein
MDSLDEARRQSTAGWQPTTDHCTASWRPAVARRPPLGALTSPSARNFFFLHPPLFAHVVNSCWLAPTHARPA